MARYFSLSMNFFGYSFRLLVFLGGRGEGERICHWLGKILSTGLSTLGSICNEVAMDFSSKLVIYPLTSVCIFSMLFSIHFLRC